MLSVKSVIIYIVINMKRNDKDIIYFIAIIILIYYGYTIYVDYTNKPEEKFIQNYTLNDIPEYSGEDYIIINSNNPNFENYENINTSFETYGELDYLGRCTYAYALLGVDLMPTSQRENISMVKPTGWNYSKYEMIDGQYLFNRCHLIAYQLSGENANEKNLITCTRHTNSDVMNEFEIKVGNYIRKTKNHVLYRVRPIFDNDNLIASGIQMEALSVEDNGKGIKFNIYIYNIQPGIYIDYKNGNNYLIEIEK